MKDRCTEHLKDLITLIDFTPEQLREIANSITKFKYS